MYQLKEALNFKNDIKYNINIDDLAKMNSLNKSSYLQQWIKSKEHPEQ